MTDQLNVSQRAREAAARIVTIPSPDGDRLREVLAHAFARFERELSTNKDETIAKLLLELDDAYGRAVCFSDGCVGCADNARSIHRALTSTEKEG